MLAYLAHVERPLDAMVQTQSLSPARLVFLISLVVFFTVLFVVAYVWMRRPGFGQEGSSRPESAQEVASDPFAPESAHR